jgi:hypothetical protein
MDRLPDHLPERAPDRGCCFRGNPGRPSAATKRGWVEAKTRELADAYGGLAKLSPVDRTLLESAAALLVRRPRNGEDSVRLANSISRLLNSVARRHGVRRRSRPSSNWLEAGGK